MSDLRWGVIGMSEGNGHPYSWSAICNGYDPRKMEHCSFPAIPEYLGEQKWPEARLSGVRVSHVWTQDGELSKKIARAARIETVVDTPEQMLGKIDGLLLARDDAENHLRFARPFIAAGVPVYIDKPIALSVRLFDEIMSLVRHDWKVFTCSALRYATELRLDDDSRAFIGKLHTIEAETPKEWDTYAVHVIDPVLATLSSDDSIVRTTRDPGDGKQVTLNIKWASGLCTRFRTLGESDAKLSIRFMGSQGELVLAPSDTFLAFKKALTDFRDSMVEGVVKSPSSLNRRIVEVLELGRTS